MKVSELIKQLSELNPDEEVFALVYHRAMFPDLDGELSPEGAWNIVCEQHNKHYNDEEIYSSIVSELSEMENAE
jgi:hypothetical protein